MVELTAPASAFDRDRWGRPMVVPPLGGKAVAYTRCTTFVSALEDTTGLAKWQQRKVAQGLCSRPDLLLAIASLDDPERADKSALGRICEQALEAAQHKVAATTGTALHKFCERLDFGVSLGNVPPHLVDDVKAYQLATEVLEVVGVETFTVQDHYRIGGTFDRLVKVNGVLTIGDLKGLALTTALPTPQGWTTMGAVRVGDEVFAADGCVCRVVVKSPVKRIGTYVVTFDDGSQVVCDREHIWWTTAGHKRTAEPTAKPIEEIIATLRYQGQTHHRVPVAGALKLPTRDLPIDPYLLGCWLGDGHQRDGCITKADDLFDILKADGHQLGVRQNQPAGKEHIATRTVVGLNTALNEAGLRRNKHIPAMYLRASAEQRLLLLQGLMDTDGTWNTARNRAIFCSTDKALAVATEELLTTLGQRPHLAEVEARGFGLTVTAYHVDFTPAGINPFRLSRKARQAAASTKPTFRARRRIITSVEPGPDVATACIGVDSPNRTYLCGEQMIPTHNTGTLDYGVNKIAMQLAVYAHSQLYDRATAARTPLGDVDLEHAVIIHLPAGAGRCTLHHVNIAAGWDKVELAAQVREWRSRRDLLTPFPLPATGTAAAGSLPDQLANAASVQELNRLWAEHQTIWNDSFTQIAAARKALLAPA